jgi:mRNA-degrading endonuclease toxin of MazEF toxin-antitoxin module
MVAQPLAAAPPLPKPRRGEIWFIKLATDPPEKTPRPVVIVSLDGRNQHPLATTVTVVPISTTVKEYDSHVPLSAGETGLPEDSEAQGENITVVLKRVLKPAESRLRTLSNATLRRIARAVIAGMGVTPNELV